MGGLLAKLVFLDSPMIQRRIRGIYFIATPHMGSGIARILDPFRCLGIFSKSVHRLVLDSPFLLNINKRFLTHQYYYDITIESAFETRKFLGIFVVNQRSSKFAISSCTNIPIYKTHQEIIKLSSKSELLYICISRFIKNCISLNDNSLRDPAPLGRIQIFIRSLMKE